MVRRVENEEARALKFALFPRVSTEAQKREGESLQVQREQLKSAVGHLGGEIVAWFGGQEHATAGWDRAQFSALLVAAERGEFDAVMVTDLSRWSRDNARSKKELVLLRKVGVRFFMLGTEFDLNDSFDRFMIGATTEMNEFFASEQSKKATLSRIERAKRGEWTVGNPPPGRSYDKKNKRWVVDEKFKWIVEQMAEDYLGNDIGFAKLGRKHDFGSPHRTHKVMVKCAGSRFEQRFRLESAGIDKVVVTEVPRLLSDEVIERIRWKAEARRTYARGQQKFSYQLSRKIIDARTGRSLTGATSGKNNIRVYRTYRTPEGVKPFAVRADHIEYAVSSELGRIFASDGAFMKAVLGGHDSTEDRARDLMEKSKTLRRALGKLKGEQKRVLDAFAKSRKSKRYASEWLEESESRMLLLEADLLRVDRELERIPTERELQRQRKEAVRLLKKAMHKPSAADVRPGGVRSYLRSGVGLSKEVLGLLLGGKDADGRRYGVYVYPHLDGPRHIFNFEVYGKLGTLVGRLSPSDDPEPYDVEWRGGDGGTALREIQHQLGGEFEDKTTYTKLGPR
ncbi:MAG: recombinase family protein [Desulfarculus sp.]|nr:recombinase family protein [Pseudomonadota bacterium]MBU4596569.1 recombinase family protein [Pseudomonadota bacterium]MBV1717595.1 recombinase family protein [Desulfarculus sp.]MBV1736812.1 recombinase family protein [Desulfarculus sp.]